MAVSADVQRAFERVVQDHVDAPLRAAGFRRRGKAWHLDSRASPVPIVSLQELSRHENSVEFVLNWGIFSSEFYSYAFPGPMSKPSISASPFSARLAPAPKFGDQWWRVARRGAWLIGVDGSSRPTDFSEIDAGISHFLRQISEIHTLSDLARLARALVDSGIASETFTARGRAIDVLSEVVAAEESQVTVPEMDISPPLGSDHWLAIETFDLDPEAISTPENAGDFQITFSDDVALNHSELVSESAFMIAAFPGVRRVLHEDRETLKVWGSVDLVALELAVRQWWARRLSEGNAL